MPRSSTYNTRTRRLILQLLQDNCQHALSAADIMEQLRQAGPPPNPATVYRYLDKLHSEGQVMKYVADKGEMAVYQYIGPGSHCTEHLHLQCVQCGRIIHLDCEFMTQIQQHLLRHHGFALQCSGGILYGLCESCRAAAPQPGEPPAAKEDEKESGNEKVSQKENEPAQDPPAPGPHGCHCGCCHQPE